MKRGVLGIFILILGLSTYGCNNIPFNKSVSRKPTSPKPSGVIVARVGDWYLTADDFNIMVENVNKLSDITGVSLKNFESKKNFLERLVNQALLAEYAEKEGINKERDVQLSVQNSIQALLADEVRRRIEKEVEISYKDVEDWYNKNKEAFKQYKVREIVVSTEDKAREALSKIYQGLPFSQVAMQYSEAPSRSKGGDLGYIVYNPNDKFPLFWTNVLTLNKGQVSTYFKSPEGKYYIIKLEDIKQTALEDKLRGQIKLVLTRGKVEEKVKSIINKMKEEVPVEINTDNIK